MNPPVVCGEAVLSKVMLVGQAPGDKEPRLGRPFAWTAGKTLFGWFKGACGLDESQFRSLIYMAAVCRCFPGKKAGGGDRVPAPEEIENCSHWLKSEMKILQPQLVIPVGKLAIAQFIPVKKLDEVVDELWNTRRTLPFSPRWYWDKFPKAALGKMLDKLVNMRILKVYPDLIEAKGGFVAQFARCNSSS